MKLSAAGLLILTLIAGLTAKAAELSGTLKPKFSITDQPLPDSSLRYILQVPLRLMVRHRAGNMNFNAAWILSPSGGNPALSGENDIQVFRLADPETRIFPSSWNGDESFSILQDIDRLNVRLRVSGAALTIGRQAVYWGVAKSVSPTDFIAPFQYGTLDTEYRIGVDAVRAVVPIGIMSELDAGYLFGKDAGFSESGCWLRGRFYLFKTDANLLAACFRENLMVGGSLNRSLGGGTGWVECAFVSTECFSDNPGEDTYWSLSTGYDRSWLNASLYGFLEYHFSSPGTDDPENYPGILEGSAFGSGGIYLLGKHYRSPGANWSVTPLLNFTGQALVNLTDGSAFLSVTSEYSISQNTVINAGLSRGLGSIPNDAAGDAGSEFGTWPAHYSLSAGYYF
ncbi:hypothetical protein DRQ25_03745 [Candidatus Fermentibacteria bacterium]|nr:MAG: hypothetical protein DRQ25_03745 [Candidatus Fermentibacteria bacterium]